VSPVVPGPPPTGPAADRVVRRLGDASRAHHRDRRREVDTVTA